jgi:UDP-GlcNAc:undecaprenyl-phosphate GlcNAc-1-phosphate transferase
MAIQPMVFCALLGCLISLLIIPLLLLPGLLRSVKLGRRRERDESPVAPENSSPACGLGGIALATSFLGVATLIYFLYPTAWTSASHVHSAIVWTGLAIFILGLWDDFRPLQTGWKLALQTVIAIAAFCQGVQIEAFTTSAGTTDLQLGAWRGAVTVLWLVGLTNLIDLTRRIDGLTAGVGLVLLGYRAVTGFGSGAEFPALFSIGIAGALVVILAYNLPPTRVRLGGAGAGFVGFLVASLTTVHSSHESTLSASVFVAVLVLPILGIAWLEARSRDKGSRILPLSSKRIHPRLVDRVEPPPRSRSW